MKTKAAAFCVDATTMKSRRAAEMLARHATQVSIQRQVVSEKLHALPDLLACMRISKQHSPNVMQQRILEPRR